MAAPQSNYLVKRYSDQRLAESLSTSTNLFNKDTATEGYYVNYTNGNTFANANYVLSDYIPVRPNTVYTERDKGWQKAFYDKNKAYIGGINDGFPFVTPKNCAYMRLCLLKTYKSDWQLQLGSTATAYEPYHYPIQILLPNNIPAVVGMEMNIYFDNVIMNNDLDNYQINVVCDIGTQQTERWTCVPASAGSYSLTINIYKNFVNLVATKTTTVIVKATTGGAGVNRKCLFIGDSTTAHGYWQTMMLTDFDSDSMDITTIGTINETSDPNNNCEGRSGWNVSMYYTNALSPFVFSGVFDFAQYMATHSYSGLEYVFIHLGINDTISYLTDADCLTGIASTFTQLQAIFTNIKTYNSNIKIVVMLTIPPFASQDGYGKVFGSGQTRWRHARNNHLWNKKLLETYGGRESEGYYVMPFNANLDIVNNAKTETVAVNSRNMATVVRQSDGQHPSQLGYDQMGDTVYYWLKSRES